MATNNQVDASRRVGRDFRPWPWPWPWGWRGLFDEREFAASNFGQRFRVTLGEALVSQTAG